MSWFLGSRSHAQPRWFARRRGRSVDAQVAGRPPRSATPCGANFEAQGSSHGRRKGGVYVCSAARRKGSAICPGDVYLPLAETESGILSAIETDLLDADIFGDALDLAVERLTLAAPSKIALLADVSFGTGAFQICGGGGRWRSVREPNGGNSEARGEAPRVRAAADSARD
jgi:hypothetical protein